MRTVKVTLTVEVDVVIDDNVEDLDADVDALSEDVLAADGTVDVAGYRFNGKVVGWRNDFRVKS